MILLLKQEKKYNCCLIYLRQYCANLCSCSTKAAITAVTDKSMRFCMQWTASSSPRSSSNLSCTFLTALSGSSAISGTLASTMSENKFNMRFACLEKKKRCKTKLFCKIKACNNYIIRLTSKWLRILLIDSSRTFFCFF